MFNTWVGLAVANPDYFIPKKARRDGAQAAQRDTEEPTKEPRVEPHFEETDSRELGRPNADAFDEKMFDENGNVILMRALSIWYAVVVRSIWR